jgi:hypothetical protein
MMVFVTGGKAETFGFGFHFGFDGRLLLASLPVCVLLQDYRLAARYRQVALKTPCQNGCAGRLYTSFAQQTSTSCLTVQEFWHIDSALYDWVIIAI